MQQPRIAKALASAKTVAAVERLAKADSRLAATSEQWDPDLWLLNTPGGVIDLETGIIDRMSPTTTDQDHRRSAGGRVPHLPALPERSMGGDADLIAFLQRLFGYALTGSTREHALAFFYGLGANGKSLLLSTVAGVMGDYHRTAPIETFTASNTDRHPTDLAGLRGARLVTATKPKRAGGGRKPDQGADGRRYDIGPFHAAGLLRVSAAVQAGHRRQPQARPPIRR